MEPSQRRRTNFLYISGHPHISKKTDQQTKRSAKSDDPPPRRDLNRPTSGPTLSEADVSQTESGAGGLGREPWALPTGFVLINGVWGSSQNERACVENTLKRRSASTTSLGLCSLRRQWSDCRLRAEARAGVNHPAEARKAFHGGTSTCRGPVAQETELTAHVAGRRGLRAREQESWPGQQGRWWAQAVWTLPCRRRLTRECQEGILASPAPAAVCGSAQGASGLNHEDRGPTAGGTAEPTKGAGALFLEQELFGFQHATSRMM